MLLLFLFIIFGCSFISTALYRRFALRKLLMDIPNERSSHSTPTPRGGGISIAAVYLFALIFLQQQLGFSLVQLLGFVIPGSLLAFVSYVDDMGHVNPVWRLSVQIIATFLGIYLLGGIPDIIANSLPFALRLALLLAVVFVLVWIINLYNFMDGIDGIASLEAMAVCLGLSLLLWLAVPDSSHFISPLVLAVATAGFCCWNFPKAKIFMGDIGSCFIGLQLGLLAIYYAHLDINFFWCVIILLGAFISDATVTLIRRFMRGQKIYMAHREHAYQHLAIKLGSHVPVSIAYTFITLLWLLPIASLVIMMKINWVLGLVIAYSPLVVTMFLFRAGSSRSL